MYIESTLDLLDREVRDKKVKEGIERQRFREDNRRVIVFGNCPTVKIILMLIMTLRVVIIKL